MTNQTNSKKSKRKLWLLNLFIVIGAAAITVCAFGLIRDMITRKQGQSFYASLSSGDASRPPVSFNADTAAAHHTSDVDSPEGAQPEWMPHMDFDALVNINPDIIAWIKIEGTVVDYPVVQGIDNDYYLKHMPNGEANKMGSIFLDYRNARDFSDINTLIYGHHMKSGDMFASLKEYSNQSYYDAHSTIWIYTPTRDYEVAVFAGYLLDSVQETPPMHFKDADAYREYIADIRRRSVFQSDVEVNEGDRLVTLCTCAYNFENARLIIVGKLIE